MPWRSGRGFSSCASLWLLQFLVVGAGERDEASIGGGGGRVKAMTAGWYCYSDELQRMATGRGLSARRPSATRWLFGNRALAKGKVVGPFLTFACPLCLNRRAGTASTQRCAGPLSALGR